MYFPPAYRLRWYRSPTAVRPSDPVLCGSCPLVTPYYCRLGDSCALCVYIVLCVHYCLCMCVCVVSVVWFVFCSFLQYFGTVGWVFWPVKTVSHITYTVLEGTLNTAQSNPIRLVDYSRRSSPGRPAGRRVCWLDDYSRRSSPGRTTGAVQHESE